MRCIHTGWFWFCSVELIYIIYKSVHLPCTKSRKKEGAEMAYKDAKDAYKYNNDFNREKYDRISLMVKSGKKDIIKAKAAANNESVNSFINRAIDMLLENS